jgi:hypothetical protein
MKKAARNDPSGPRKEKTYTAPRYPANGEATGLAATHAQVEESTRQCSATPSHFWLIRS